MLCIYVIVLCNISQIIFIYLLFLEKERVRDKGERGGVEEQRFTLYLNTNFIHQRSRFSAYTMTGRVNKPLDMY